MPNTIHRRDLHTNKLKCFIGQFKSKEGWKDKLFGSAVARWTKYNTQNISLTKKSQRKDYVQNCSWLTGPLVINSNVPPIGAVNGFKQILSPFMQGKLDPFQTK